MKIQTCTRCGGTGKRNTPVVYCGYPGGCYACDLSGKVVVYTMAERVELFLKRCDAHLAELERDGAELKLFLEKSLEEKQQRINARAAKLGREPRQASVDDFELLQKRKTWVEVKAMRKQVATSGKVTTHQQPRTAPSRFANV